MNHKRAGRRIALTAVLSLCLCLCLCFCAFADYITEEDGSRWYDDGHIEWPDGSVTWQVDHDQGQTHGDDDGSSGSGSSSGSDDPMIVDTGDTDPLAGIPQNEDGSITVESGQLGIDIEDSATRAPLTAEEWEQRLLNAEAINGSVTPTVYIDPETGYAYEVEVIYMGIGRSMVSINGTEMLVNTVNLKWATEAPEDEVLAVIDTPGNGYAAMYAGKTKKSTLIKQCRLDQVVRVISTGKSWTLIDHDGTRGYVRTSSLEFYANDHVDFQAALLSVKGKTQGRDTVHVRSSDHTHRYLDSASQPGEYKLGTPLTVFDIVDEWAEVDIAGWHCCVNSKYVTLIAETASR